jgi:hypothetical protein
MQRRDSYHSAKTLGHIYQVDIRRRRHRHVVKPHLYPSMPCQALPQAHKQSRAHLARLDLGYLVVNRTLIRRLACLQVPHTL